MYLRWVIFFITICACPWNIKCEIKPVLINQFNIPHAGFSILVRTWTLNSTSWALLVSCFNPIPFTADYVYRVSDIQWRITTNITPEVVTDAITWPNGIVSTDDLSPYSIIIPSGFLVPGKTSGNLYFMADKGQPTPLVPNEKTNWFYHDAALKDVDQDGHFDVVAGRANVPLVGETQTQLIWLKNPGNLTIKGPWELHILREQGGPDVQVQFAQVDSTEVLFANSFFLHLLQLYWSNSTPYWNDTNQLHVRNIDYDSVQYGYIQYTADLNGDQKTDLLVTINDPKNGSLVAYELPPTGQILTGKFVKHVIASGFKPTSSGKGKGAPGQGAPVQIYSLAGRKKPIILLSGDDDGGFYLVEALRDDDPSNWQYNTTKIHQCQGTAGQLSVEDVDSDEHLELFLPCYNEGVLYIYRLMGN